MFVAVFEQVFKTNGHAVIYIESVDNVVEQKSLPVHPIEFSVGVQQ